MRPRERCDLMEAVMFVSMLIMASMLMFTGGYLIVNELFESALFISVQLAFAYVLFCVGIAVLLVARDAVKRGAN